MSLLLVIRTLSVALCLLVVLPATSGADPSPVAGNGPGPAAQAPAKPLVIGHRGASGYRPEHTLESYSLAIEMGADFIEPDLVATQDGVLVARHENEISGTTDVADRPEFDERRTTKTIDGEVITGWFTEDFTLAELKTLWAKERIPGIRPANAFYDGQFQVPTFQEVLDLARASGVGIYPETKHPTYFDSIGKSLEEPLVATLKENGYTKKKDPVIVQSFEVHNLKQLASMTDVRLVQLFGGRGSPYDFVVSGDRRTYSDLATPAGLAEIATYADGIGPNKERVIPRTPSGTLGAPTSLVSDAHHEGLVVHPYTFRSENTFLPTDMRTSADPKEYGDHQEEYRRFFATGIDGVFSDQPDHARAAADAFAPGPRGKGETVAVQLLAINDFHGNLEATSGLRLSPSPGALAVPAGGAEYLATHIRQLEATNPNTAVVAAGDTIGASPLLSALFHDEPTIEAMNLIGLDVAGVGNHEFDEGAAELRRMQEGGCHPSDGCLDGDGFAGADFPFLAANVIDSATGEAFFEPYVIRNYQGAKVAFIGMTLEGTPSIVTPTGIQGLEFRDEADTVNALVPELRKKADAVVVLLHEGGVQAPGGGIDQCKGISGPIVDIVDRMSDEVDVVVSGHTHQAYTCDIDGKLVTGGSSFGRAVTDIDLVISKSRHDVVSATADNVVVTRDVQRAGDLTSLITKYNEFAAPLAARVIGTANAPILKTSNAAGESALGDLIADAQLAATTPAALGGAQIAFMNPGGIRADIDQGPITYGEAFTVQPFGNTLVTMSLKGSQVETLLEQQFCNPSGTSSRILQVSEGFTYAFDPTAPCGSKVDPSSIVLDGAVLDPAATYRVTVNSFLADGGDNFRVLTSGTDRLGGALDLDALEAYLGQAAAEDLPYAPRGRIRST